ncbi:MAG: sigma-70 domain-containing protein [Planctomycetota bacterium]
MAAAPWRQRLEQRKRTTEFLRAELGREPDDEEVASSMEMDSDEYQRVFGIGVPMAPTGTMAFDDAGDEAMPVLEAVPDMGWSCRATACRAKIS